MSDLDAFKAAAEFMAHVRKMQQGSSKSLGGLVCVHPEQASATRNRIASSQLVSRVKESLGLSTDDIGALFERFEEMCRRNRVSIQEPLRPEILRMLSIELLANVAALGGHPKHLIAITVYHGACGEELKNDFKELGNHKAELRFVARHYPRNPRRTLQTIASEALHNQKPKSPTEKFLDRTNSKKRNEEPMER